MGKQAIKGNGRSIERDESEQKEREKTRGEMGTSENERWRNGNEE